MSSKFKIGIIGLDTSHVIAFTELLNDQNSEYHVPGGEISVAFPGGSEDMELSRSRVRSYTDQLRNRFGVSIAGSPEAVAEECSAILLTSVDGRVHLEQFRKVASYGRPTFVDKPFAVTSADAEAMISLAGQYSVPIMSCSALRYAEGFTQILNETDKGDIRGVDCYGPMPMQPTQPGLFWYGIHTVEMLFAALGKGCRYVVATTNADHDLVVGVWADGRIGTIRGNRTGIESFGALVHRTRKTQFAEVNAHPKPYYASLLEGIMSMYRTSQSAVDPQETLEIIKFIEAANQSREDGQPIPLA